MIFAAACSLQGAVQSILHFLACPEFLKVLHVDPETINRILQSDFNCGYIAAIATVVLLIVFLFFLKLLDFIFFRTKRCSRVTVALEGGSIIVKSNAIEATVRNEIRDFGQISLRKLLLFKSGKNYSLKLLCEFDSKGEGMPEIAQKLRPRLQEVMQNLFGITNMTDISIIVERLRGGDGPEQEEKTFAADAHTGL